MIICVLIIVYSTDHLSKISRPAMVITENAVTSNHYFNRQEDIEMARFTVILQYLMHSLIDVIGTIFVGEFLMLKQKCKLVNQNDAYHF